ncbi:FAD-binding monooxygenase [Corynebacterium sp. CNJ-954]|uniref:FAD-dependent oxidoreductase n=1 Tax=Corynebacterium sp. CNJ-954 TaxID=1904962 RepID=UPI00096992C2|nr:NAD(P)/FAD-dependent oxidoreductase [Corynebacterium sp. CNJ-954]OLT54307.1 FAD-binding monooxygenase [Corynebacterium sp. CNJ-954]
MRTAEIAGAGLAGLTVATRLAQLGWNVRLHERNEELRMFGAGIWLWESGLKALETIGAFKEALERAKEIQEWRIADHLGNTMMSRRSSADDRLMLPPRADLYEALIKQARSFGVQIETSSLVTKVDPMGRIETDSGSNSDADLVIVADGAYSRLRECISGTSWMDFGKQAGVRMLIEHNDADGYPDDTIVEYWNGNRRLIYNPCTGTHDYVFMSAPVSDTRGGKIPIDRKLWAQEFPEVSTLIERCSEGGRWDRLVNVRCRTWTKGKVAIIGDAAHAMPPNLGQAANTAFNNAMALAYAVDRSTDVPSALRTWEATQRTLTNHVQNWSYGYGYVLGNCPPILGRLRQQCLTKASETSWFDRQLNRGARAIPAGS